MGHMPSSLQAQVGQSGEILRSTRTKFPKELELRLGNRYVVDGRVTGFHQAVVVAGVKLPILITVRAVPLSRCRRLVFVTKSHGNTIVRIGPQLLDETILGLVLPLLGQKSAYGLPAGDELIAVAPHRVDRISEFHPIGIATIPSVFGEMDFARGRVSGKRWSQDDGRRRSHDDWFTRRTGGVAGSC
jgi:hypothetical protein